MHLAVRVENLHQEMMVLFLLINASLQMGLELVLWKTVSDITKDRKVLKKILKEGEGYERPNDGAMIQELSGCIISIDSVKHIGKLQDEFVFLKKGHDDDQPFEFRIDEVIDGLDRAVKNMKKGETALVIIQLDRMLLVNLLGNWLLFLLIPLFTMKLS
ncbi:peptidyl-prolyl cis-trans isomerase FKBP62 [Trifolium repens]|nr:peptidyl-prolyl cis-trans isomerase FKBP62 [Trifolium repens]